MAEVVSYATPQFAKPGATSFDLADIQLSKKRGMIKVEFEGNDGTSIIAIWSDNAGEDATGLMRSLNKLDMRTNTFRMRLIARAIADNKLPAGGTLAGAAD